MDIAPTQVVQRASDALSAEVGPELVLLSGELQSVGLDVVGRRVWQLLEEPRSFDRLVDELMGEFETDKATCQRDVSRFLASLDELGLVEFV